MNFFVVSLIKIVIVFGVLMTTLAYLQWIERKVLAHIQVRTGPLRVGPHGLMQPLADVFKLLTKEDLFPPQVNRLVYLLAPFLAVCLALISISIIPFGPEINIFGVRTYMQISDLNVGVLFALAVSALSVYAVALAGWSSNNKYSLIGGLRGSAQLISYELPLTLAVAAPLLLANHLSFRAISNSQSGYYLGFIPRWNIFQMPFPQIFGFIIFMIAAFAETNRLPFDLPEAENELVAGFHTEYSSMKFACFFMSEYANMITISCIATLLFLGGWHPLFPAPYSNYIPSILLVLAAILLFYRAVLPARVRDRRTFPVFGIAALILAVVFAIPILQIVLIPVFWFASKVGIFLFTYIWVRGTLPRFRYDQLMHFAWTFLFPFALLNLLLTALFVALF
ncbi:MAG: NADH-quinone oxidoreductase subunit H [Acidobacteriaceae bacterium]|nr:NADH-quinone oxidoreductase subunit H [Acidobacteriaceae bacterium]MBV9779618.1 NADH-quinone oxidoreductase subunit H [Acidobacteriaceae bacterium]